MLENMEVQNVFRHLPLSEDSGQYVWLQLVSEKATHALIEELLEELVEQEEWFPNLDTELNCDPDQGAEALLHVVFIDRLLCILSLLGLPLGNHSINSRVNEHLQLCFHHVFPEDLVINHASEAFNFALINLKSFGECFNPADLDAAIAINASNGLLPSQMVHPVRTSFCQANNTAIKSLDSLGGGESVLRLDQWELQEVPSFHLDFRLFLGEGRPDWHDLLS